MPKKKPARRDTSTDENPPRTARVRWGGSEPSVARQDYYYARSKQRAYRRQQQSPTPFKQIKTAILEYLRPLEKNALERADEAPIPAKGGGQRRGLIRKQVHIAVARDPTSAVPAYGALDGDVIHAMQEGFAGLEDHTIRLALKDLEQAGLICKADDRSFDKPVKVWRVRSDKGDDKTSRAGQSVPFGVPNVPVVQLVAARDSVYEKVVIHEREVSPDTPDEPAGPTDTIVEPRDDDKPATHPSSDLPVLSPAAAAVYEILLEVPPHRGMTGPKLLDALEKRGVYTEQSTLTSRIIPELKAYGVEGVPRKGYRIPLSKRPAK